MLNSTIDDFRRALAGSPSPDVTRQRLYAPVVHWIVRIAYGALSVPVAGVAIGMAASLREEEYPLRFIAVGIPIFMFVALILATNLRTCALYGSPRGLEIARWGKRRVVPWSKVGPAEYAWWSTNKASRVARFTIRDEKERTYTFFANDQVLADFEELRALYARLG